MSESHQYLECGESCARSSHLIGPQRIHSAEKSAPGRELIVGENLCT